MRTGGEPNPADEPGGLTHVERLVRAHLRNPVPHSVPRPAVTVVLLRDGDPGLQVFLLERAATMAFAPRHTVFPGGSVDVADGYVDAIADRSELTTWADGFGCEVEQAARLLAAAAREVFEESGVLLALDARTGCPVRCGDLGSRRADLVAKRLTFSEVLAATGAVLSPALLHPWARWVTPVWSPRRYDTHFFVAELPAGQEATDGSGEATAVAWRTPADALARARDGRVEMLTPTFETLAELAEMDTATDAMSSERDLGLIEFSLHSSPDHVEIFVNRPTGRTLLMRVVP